MKCSVAFLLSFLLLALTGLAQDPTSQDAKERKKAAEQLSKDGASALPTLSKLTTDVDLDVRREAVRSVVQIGTTQSIDI